MGTKKEEIIFPRPFAFAIDDFGWMTGNDHGYGDYQGPFRVGIDRKMDVDNYKSVVKVAEAKKIRLMGLFILGEMDRLNILGKYPTTNPDGKNWDNSKNICDEQIEIMNYVKQNAANLEFGLHGVLHEYWPEVNQRRRAEWYNLDDDHPWPEEIMHDHVKCFKEIMAQYDLTEEAGHSFPESFVACAYGYYWNPAGEYSTGSVLGPEGVKYANTMFQEIPELSPPKEPNGGGFDHGLLVVNRNIYGTMWHDYTCLPTVPIDEQESDLVESHWSNWLAPDDSLQDETNQKWIDYLTIVQQQRDRYLAKNTQQFYSQWLYKKYTCFDEKSDGVAEIDNSKMPDTAYRKDFLAGMVLKVALAKGQHISAASIDNKEIASYFEDEGFGFLYLPVLERKKYTLKYSVGTSTMPHYVYNDGTYNIYSFTCNKDVAALVIRLYGTQVIKIVGISSPQKIDITNPKVTLLDKNYNEDSKTLFINLKAHDIVGETTTIGLIY
ncbi:MAG: hypothetical protein IH595_01560 [Bacteroidales bacterium]|nr:hypothetical protein [Bacteroidales bacterium]